MKGKQQRINWQSEPYLTRIKNAVKEFQFRRAKNQNITVGEFSKEKNISKSVFHRLLQKMEQQSIQQKSEQQFEGMIHKARGGVNHDPIVKNEYNTKAPTPKRKQPERPAKRSKRGEFRCTCKYDGKTNCADGRCGNDVSSIECDNDNCSFGDVNCGNRKYLCPYLTSCFPMKIEKLSGEKLNLGLVAFEHIPQFVYIGDYVGVVRDKKDSRGLYCAALKVGGKNFVVDASETGDLTRYINHSCEPNCQMIQRQVAGEHQVWIRTLQEIKEIDELVMDCGSSYFTRKDPCLCGAAKCRYLAQEKNDTIKGSGINPEQSLDFFDAAIIMILDDLWKESEAVNTLMNMDDLRKESEAVNTLMNMRSREELRHLDEKEGELV